MFYCFLSRYLKYTYLLVCLTVISIRSYGQVTIRYQNTIQGGATLIGNSWFYSPGGTRLTPDIDGDASTSLSCSADLILPAGSTIVKAYLAIEQGLFNTAAFSSVKIKVPGASSYTTLSSGTSLANRVVLGDASSYFHQMIWDITSIMPASGYVSVAGGGAGGRYTLADPTPIPDYMGGWSIIVVYSNPNSKFRHVTVADNWQYYFNATVSSNVTGVKVPSSGTVKAVVGVTGTYGDRGYAENLMDRKGVIILIC
jgi:hypothetical protein